MAIGAGPLYVNAVMGQASSACHRDRKSGLQITARHDIDIEESEHPSRPDSWSMHYDRTDQAPYSSSTRDKNTTMNTGTSLLHLPKENPSRELAFFLRTTGPTAPHRRPSKIGKHPRRAIAAPKNALRFLKFGHKRSLTPASIAREEELLDAVPLHPIDTEHYRADEVEWHDVGGLLSEKKSQAKSTKADCKASPFLQEMSSAGKRYLAIIPQADDAGRREAGNDMLDLAAREPSPAVMDSEVSISYADSISSPEVCDSWRCVIAHDQPPSRAFSPPRNSSAHLQVREKDTLRVVNPSSPATIQRHTSNPPTPEPQSAAFTADSSQSDLTEHPGEQSMDTSRALSSHPVHSTTTSLPLPKPALPHKEAPVRHLRSSKHPDIKHPAPRRFASHPVLLQRASSITSSSYLRSTSDSPGPPPRSPLRLRRDQRTIDDAIASHMERNATPKSLLSLSQIGEYSADISPIKPTVTTVCTGPIKRPSSGGKGSVLYSTSPRSKREREERTMARKLRDKPPARCAIHAFVNASPRDSRQRLKKARPQIAIPELRPAPLTTRSSSTASSNTSWKKITEYTRTPVSAVPSETTPVSPTGYTPISPAASNGIGPNKARVTLSPVMLVAEEMPVPKTKTCKPVRLAMKEGKSYSPRPRSASLSRSALRGRMASRSHASTRANSPAREPQDEETQTLPSPPPNRKLPPTPPTSGSDRRRKCKTANHRGTGKDLPPTPMLALASHSCEQAVSGAEPASIPTDAPRRSGSCKETGKSPDFDARLAALEHHNKLLSAALMAVLRTSGERNSPFAELASFESPSSPPAWETRLAKRTASDAASSSNGSALEMYMSTRRGSRHGF